MLGLLPGRATWENQVMLPGKSQVRHAEDVHCSVRVPHGMTNDKALGKSIRQRSLWGGVRIGEVADRGEGFTTRSLCLQALNGKPSPPQAFDNT